jgi:hypothetical protein
MFVQPRACAVRKANQKGRVERTIRWLRDRFLAGRRIDGVEQGNHELARFRETIALDRPHPTLPRTTVRQCLQQERMVVLRLPDVLPSTDAVVPVSVDKTAFVRFDTNAYSVPPTFVAQTLTLVAGDRRVRILDVRGDPVAEHERCWGQRQVIEAVAHRQALLAEKRGGRESKGRDRLRAAVPQIDQLFERWVAAGCNVGSMTARTLVLLDLYGADLFALAVADVLARGTFDVGAIAQLCEQRRRAHDRPVPIPLALGTNVPERDVIPHDLESYDAPRRR